MKRTLSQEEISRVSGNRGGKVVQVMVAVKFVVEIGFAVATVVFLGFCAGRRGGGRRIFEHCHFLFGILF